MTPLFFEIKNSEYKCHGLTYFNNYYNIIVSHLLSYKKNNTLYNNINTKNLKQTDIYNKIILFSGYIRGNL